MSINFSRNRTQLEYERILGISNLEQLKNNKDLFKNHILTIDESLILKSCLNEDCLDFFYNSLISFAEGIDAIYSQRFSWATVKLYYSIFYSLRTSLACHNIALLRNASLFRLKVSAGEKVFGTNSKKYNSTHKGTISHYKDLFGSSDLLLSNKIDIMDVYEWMEEVRNIINYNAVSFEDPGCLSIWDKYNDALNDDKINELIQTLIEDEYVYCFQEEYAVLAIPIKRMQETIKDMVESGLMDTFQQERKVYVDSILKSESRKINIY